MLIGIECLIILGGLPMLSFKLASIKAIGSFNKSNIHLLTMTLIVYLSTFFLRSSLVGLLLSIYMAYVYFQTVYKIFKKSEKSFKAFFKPSLNIFSFSLFIMMFMIISSIFSYLVYITFITQEIFLYEINPKAVIAGLLFYYLFVIYLSIRSFPVLFLVFEGKNPLKAFYQAWLSTKKFQFKLFVFFGLVFFLAAAIIYGVAYFFTYSLIVYQNFWTLPLLIFSIVFSLLSSFFIQQFFMVFLFDLYQQLVA